MIEWTGMTQERYNQLKEDSTLRHCAAEEIWGELNRMRDILFEIRKAHYAMISWGIREGSPERDPDRHEAYLEYLRERGIATVGGRGCK